MIDMLIYSGWAPHVALVLYLVVGALVVTSPTHVRVRGEIAKANGLKDGPLIAAISALTWPTCFYCVLTAAVRHVRGIKGGGATTLPVLVLNLAAVCGVLLLIVF